MADDSRQDGGANQAIDDATQRRIAAALFNHAWTLMEKADRTPEDDSLMVHAAHASAWHWRQVGTPVNFARSEWQCARIYAVLARATAATRHARRCLDICLEHDITGFDLAFAYEALARAAAIMGDTSGYQRHHARATEAAAAIAADDDRDYLFRELNSIPEWVTTRRPQSGT